MAVYCRKSPPKVPHNTLIFCEELFKNVLDDDAKLSISV